MTTTVESLLDELKPHDPVVHGLVSLNPKRLPFKITLNEDQRVVTCVCNSGWLAITPDPKEAFRAHVDGV